MVNQAMCQQVATSFFQQIDWVNLITGALIPIVIMLITLHSEKKRHCESLKQQADEHKKEMLEQKESVRLGLLPIFNVVGMTGAMEPMPTLSGAPKEHHILKIRLENVGSGIAISPHIKWDEVDGAILNHPFDKSETAYYCCYKDFSYEDMVAPPGKEIEIQVVRKPKEGDLPVDDYFILPIGFNDVLRNKYEQRIALSFFLLKDRNVEINNISAITPVLLQHEENSDEAVRREGEDNEPK